MRIFELSPRLRAVAELVPQGARFVDVGTDHAYLPVWLILQGRIDHAVVSDLRAGPLDRARQTAQHYDVDGQLSFRLCDGLAAIKSDEADTIAIAGIGGETIAAILAAAPWTAAGQCRLLLQPMSAQEDLRRWLYRHGYRIEREYLVQEGKTLYTMFSASAGADAPLTLAEEWAGRQGREHHDPLRGLYLERVLSRAQSALEGIRRSKRPEDAVRCVELEQAAQELLRMKEEWDTWQR